MAEVREYKEGMSDAEIVRAYRAALAFHEKTGNGIQHEIAEQFPAAVLRVLDRYAKGANMAYGYMEGMKAIAPGQFDKEDFDRLFGYVEYAVGSLPNVDRRRDVFAGY